MCVTMEYFIFSYTKLHWLCINITKPKARGIGDSTRGELNQFNLVETEVSSYIVLTHGLGSPPVETPIYISLIGMVDSSESDSPLALRQLYTFRFTYK